MSPPFKSSHPFKLYSCNFFNIKILSLSCRRRGNSPTVDEEGFFDACCSLCTPVTRAIATH